MRQIQTLAIVIALAAAGCMAKSRSTFDEMTGVRSDELSGHYVTMGMSGNFRIGFIQREHVETESASYLFKLQWDGPDWFFIEDGQSLWFKFADDEIIKLSGEGSAANREVSGHSRVLETATYEMDLEVIKRLATSDRVLMRVVGSKGYQNIELDSADLAYAKRFLDTYVQMSPPSRPTDN